MEWKMVKQHEIIMRMVVMMRLDGWVVWWMWQGTMQDEEWNESWHGSMDGVGWRDEISMGNE